MVYVIIPAEGGLLSSFLFKGSMGAKPRGGSSVYDGASGLFVYSGGRVVGPFSILSVSDGTVRCGVSEPVRSVPHDEVRIPTRISDSMADRLLSSAPLPSGYVPITGDASVDGLLASAVDGRIRFASEDWDVMSHYTSLLSGLGIPFTMTSPFEIRVDDSGLCSRCAAVPVPSRVSDDRFMSGFLAPRTSSGRVFGCPDWAVEAFGSRVVVTRDPYGNPSVSPMSSGVFPFDRIGAARSRDDTPRVPESFAFAAAEAVFLSALESGGYEVDGVWQDSLCSMCEASKGDLALTLVLVPRLSDETVFQMRDHVIPDSATVVALGRRIRSAPMERVRPFLSAKGIDWSCVSAISGPGPEIPPQVAEEAERCLGAVWGAYSN